MPRQPAEGRCRASGAEHEPDVRVAADGGIAVRVVVKIGGAAIEDAVALQACASAVTALAAEHQVAVVHGGGAALTRTLSQMGKASEFVNGMRVTDVESRDVALMVLAGIVNKTLVAALASAHQPAMGICGGD